MSEKLWEQAVLRPHSTIRQSIDVMNRVSLGMALVVDDASCLLGIITDGDIRRGLLQGISLEQPVKGVMNTRPIVGDEGMEKEELLTLMENKDLICIPIVNVNKKLIDVKIFKYLRAESKHNNWVFLMAGGFGTRLKPLTDHCPKPMLKIGGKPVLQGIIENCKKKGFKKFLISVHYKFNMIMDYFGNGDALDVEIKYICEDKPLGTGGALGLLPHLNEPLLMMNGDVLTNVDFRQLLRFHSENSADATICVRDHELQVPYGVVQSDDYRFVKIVEKPIHHFFINAGIYVLSPATVNRVQGVGYLDMPDLLSQLLTDKKQIIMFPIHENWQDIGRMDDFKKAQLMAGASGKLV